MDFELTEEQQALTELAGRILSDQCGHERLTSLEADARKNGIGSVHDAATWKALADAGVISALLPDEDGDDDDGGGLGVMGLALLTEAVGKHTAYLPAVATLALGALPIARYGSGALKALLDEVAAGGLLLTAALEEPGEPESLTTTAHAAADGYVLEGAKTMVPYGDLADRIIVPATLPDGRIVATVVHRGAPGLKTTPLLTTGKQPYADLDLQGVRVAADDILGTPEQGTEIVAWIRAVGTATYAAEAAGVCTEAVRMTAKYTSERRQFGEPIASFQAVGQRAADAYIDAEVLRLTMLHAAWMLDDQARGEEAIGPEIDTAVAIAKFHAGDAGSRVLHACQHLHGGIGVDIDYPLHRYFIRGQQIEQTLGTATRQLLRIGAHLSSESTP
jgi:alkylation response protein AidB-like acyl-CoA dehydrogenase